MGIETALIGGALVGGAASIYSGKKAAGAQRDASRDANRTTLEMFYQNRDDFAPYRNIGTGALERLASMYGISGPQQTEPMSYEEFVASDLYNAPQPSAQQARPRFGGRASGLNQLYDTLGGYTVGTSPQQQYDQYVANFTPETVKQNAPGAANDFSSFYESPDYKFAYDQGLRTVEQSLARRGLGGPSDSGAAAKELMRYGQGMASQQFGNYRNFLASLAGIGQTATSQVAGMGTQAANQVASNQLRAGDARASSYLNTGQAVGNVARIPGQYRLLQAGGYIK